MPASSSSNNINGTKRKDAAAAVNEEARRLQRPAIKDSIVTADGRVYYPCQYCSKAFTVKRNRAAHLRRCAAKSYILSVDGENNEPPSPGQKIIIQQNIPLCGAASPPPKPVGAGDNIVDKLQSLAEIDVLLLKTPPTGKRAAATDCRVCAATFAAPLDLLRHSREMHSYPRMVMAPSEIEKYYDTKDRGRCPICEKPLKNQFRSAFIKHLHIHSDVLKYSCRVCKKRFRRLDHMRSHAKRHINSTN